MKQKRLNLKVIAVILNQLMLVERRNYSTELKTWTRLSYLATNVLQSTVLFIKLGKLKGKCLLGLKCFFYYKVKSFHSYFITWRTYLLMSPMILFKKNKMLERKEQDQKNK